MLCLAATPAMASSGSDMPSSSSRSTAQFGAQTPDDGAARSVAVGAPAPGTGLEGSPGFGDFTIGSVSDSVSIRTTSALASIAFRTAGPTSTPTPAVAPFSTFGKAQRTRPPPPQLGMMMMGPTALCAGASWAGMQRKS